MSIFQIFRPTLELNDHRMQLRIMYKLIRFPFKYRLFHTYPKCQFDGARNEW